MQQQRCFAEGAVATQTTVWDELGGLVSSDEGKRELAALRSTYVDIAGKLASLAKVGLNREGLRSAGAPQMTAPPLLCPPASCCRQQSRSASAAFAWVAAASGPHQLGRVEQRYRSQAGAAVQADL